MKAWQVAVIILVVLMGTGALVCGGALFLFASAFRSARTPAEERSQPMATLTAPQLLAELAENEARFYAKYEGHWVEVKGEISSIDRASFNLGGGTLRGALRCFPEDKGQLLPLQMKQQVTAIGKVDRLLGSLVLKQAKIKEGPADTR